MEYLIKDASHTRRRRIKKKPGGTKGACAPGQPALQLRRPPRASAGPRLVGDIDGVTERARGRAGGRATQPGPRCRVATWAGGCLLPVAVAATGARRCRDGIGLWVVGRSCRATGPRALPRECDGTAGPVGRVRVGRECASSRAPHVAGLRW